MRKDVVSKEKLAKYFSVTKKALDMVLEKGFDNTRTDEAVDFLDMAQRYFDDAKHFEEKGEIVTAFAALNYAHGWLDAGARIKLFKVKDSTLFTVDDE
ncbi:DUF357 domain-containing protein [Candidatus Woesearchaeota archaeon]|nr:DUF357 domain-containing protein [Candidatus Woesearchaeota archaeon]